MGFNSGFKGLSHELQGILHLAWTLNQKE